MWKHQENRDYRVRDINLKIPPIVVKANVGNFTLKMNLLIFFKIHQKWDELILGEEEDSLMDKYVISKHNKILMAEFS